MPEQSTPIHLGSQCITHHSLLCRAIHSPSLCGTEVRGEKSSAKVQGQQIKPFPFPAFRFLEVHVF